MPVGAVLAAHVLVMVILAAGGSVLLVVSAALAYDIHAPADVLGVFAAFLLGVLAFAAIGMLLGVLLPTARTTLAVLGLGAGAGLLILPLRKGM